MDPGIEDRYFRELKKNLAANTITNSAIAIRTSRVIVIGNLAYRDRGGAASQ